jgi:hypothetical protein
MNVDPNREPSLSAGLRPALRTAVWTGDAALRPWAGRAPTGWRDLLLSRNGLAGTVSQRCRTVDRVLAPGERFGVVLADPAYIPSQVARFPEDPLLAIDGGPDGLVSIRGFPQLAAAHLAGDGVLILEARGRRQIMQTSAWLEEPGAPALALGIHDHDSDRSLALLTHRGPAAR